MTALVSNIIRPIDLSTTLLTAAAVGGADDAYPSGFVGTAAGSGIDGVSGINFFENVETATVAGNWYGAWAPFTSPTSIDMSGTGKAFAVHFRVSGTFNSVYQIRISLRSGSGTTNWGYWDFPVSTNDIVAFNVFRAEGTPDGTLGTFDPTDVTGVSLQVRAVNTDVYALSAWWDQFLFIDGPVVFEDTGTPAQVSLQAYFDLLERTSSEIYRSLLVNKAGTTFELGFPVEFRCDDYQDSTVATGFAFMAADGVGIRSVPVGFYQLRFVPPASSILTFSGFTAATVSSDYDLFVDASASGCDLNFTASLFAGVNNADFSGSGLTITSSNLLSPESCDLGDGDFQNFTIDACSVPVVVTSPLTTGSVVSITNPVGDSLQFDAAAGDFSGITINLPSSTVNINSAGSYDLSGIASSGSIEFDNLTASAVTVTVSATLTTTVASPTTGGGSLTIELPAFAPTVTLTGLQNPSEVRIFTAGTQTELAGQEVVTSGTYSVQLPVGTTSIDIAILSLGYENARILGISTTQDVSIPISQKLDRQYFNP